MTESFFRRVLNKTQDFVADPRLNDVTKVARGMLEVAAQIGQAKVGGPLSAAGAVLGTLNVIQEHLDIEKTDPVKQRLKKLKEERGIEQHTSSLPELLVETGAISVLPMKTFATSNAAHLIGIEQGAEMMLLKVYPTAMNDKVEPVLWKTEKFDFSVLRDSFWNVLGGPIVKMTPGVKLRATLVASQYDTVPYLGEHSPAEFADILRIYRERGISRSTFLQGPPGTGKTSFVRAYAKHTNTRLVVVTPALLGSGARNDIEVFVDLLRPDTILFDDIDHAPNGLDYALTLVDDLRRQYPDMLVITTCNNLQVTNTTAALMRPGRLGERLQFLAPGFTDKKVVLEFYLAHYGVDASKLDVDTLVHAMTHEHFSQDYVRFIAEQAVVFGQDRLLKQVADVNDYLEALGESLLQRLVGNTNGSRLEAIAPEDSPYPEDSPI